jgi:hypothetical protein
MKNPHTCCNMPTTLLTGTLGGAEAFEKAQAEDNPVFLSIGYN